MLLSKAKKGSSNPGNRPPPPHRCASRLLPSIAGSPSLALQAQDLARPAVTPQPRVEEWWFSRQAEHIGLMSKGEFDLLMVGDSITNNFETVREAVWKKHFAPRKAISLGFVGDRTNHVLWRPNHLSKLKTEPKAAVVLIGTNNICWGSDEPEQAAMGVAAVAAKLHGLYPTMEVLVLGVFPRRREASHPHRKEIVALNAGIVAPSRHGREVRHLKADTPHPEHRGQESLGLTRRQVEDEAQGDRRLDREVRRLAQAAAPASARWPPCGVGE